jgi:hypothetical protein
MNFRYVLYGKEKNKDTGIHPIGLYITYIGAIIARFLAKRNFNCVYLEIM